MTILILLTTIIGMFAIYNTITNYLFPTLNAKEVSDNNVLQINPESPEKANSIFEFSALDIDGNIVNLSKYRGLVTYIVNVASK